MPMCFFLYGANIFVTIIVCFVIRSVRCDCKFFLSCAYVIFQISLCSDVHFFL